MFVNMRNLQIVNMPNYRYLFVIYNLIRNTWVIRVDNETISFQNVVCCKSQAQTLANHKEPYSLSLLVRCNTILVHCRVYQKQSLNKGSSQFHEQDHLPSLAGRLLGSLLSLHYTVHTRRPLTLSCMSHCAR